MGSCRVSRSATGQLWMRWRRAHDARGQPNQEEVGQALLGDVDLDLDQVTVEPDQGGSEDRREHGPSLEAKRHGNRHAEREKRHVARDKRHADVTVC